jgi:hypothetical protein
MRNAGRDNDTRPRGFGQLWQEQRGQREHAQMIDPELRFEALFGAHQRRVHDAGIVDKCIYARLLCRSSCSLTNTFDIAQIEG